MPYFCAIQGTILCPLSQSDQWPAPPQGPGGCGSERESGATLGSVCWGAEPPKLCPSLSTECRSSQSWFGRDRTERSRQGCVRLAAEGPLSGQGCAGDGQMQWSPDCC